MSFLTNIESVVYNLEKKTSKTTPIEENRDYHRRYFLAINNPSRREILRAIKKGYSTINEIKKEVGLKEEILNWHLSILGHGNCVKETIIDSDRIFTLTQEGYVIEYLDKEHR
jgi:DNA-binding transcriptional ArsR family regulator